ncbi:MAG: hypothetical protein K6U87_04150 [Firmicutes bacterium]|nr:hypothetical protein [Bacillota bacterium]
MISWWLGWGACVVALAAGGFGAYHFLDLNASCLGATPEDWKRHERATLRWGLFVLIAWVMAIVAYLTTVRTV